MGCTASSQRAATRTSRQASVSLSNSDNSAATNPMTNKNPTKTNNDDCNLRPRRSFMQANDRVSLAAALEEYDYEGSNHTASTGSNESAVICIMRSDKLSFGGAGIRRHSRRKRNRQKGKDNTRIIVLRKPARRDTTMMKVDERIPTKELKKLRKKAIATAESKVQPQGQPAPKRNSQYTSKKLVTSPMKVVRKSSLLLGRKSSGEFSDILLFDDCPKEQILSMSMSTRDFLKVQ